VLPTKAAIKCVYLGKDRMPRIDFSFSQKGPARTGLYLCLMLGAMCSACNPDAAAPLHGKWLMQRVLRAGEDVSAEHNPYGERYILLQDNQQYTSDGRPFGANTGWYTYYEPKRRLFLDSDVGPEDDSYWLVQLKADSMRWQGTGSAWAEQFEIVFVRDQ
jgi:hypothetical protein